MRRPIVNQSIKENSLVNSLYIEQNRSRVYLNMPL